MEALSRQYRSYVEPYPELKNRERIEELLISRAGSHHAGQLPGWRLLIEKLMIQGHLEVIFATSTVAAGVNFPARTVVLLQSDRFNGRGFVDMSATDIHQMTGRAGRRGMDNAGFIFVVPGKHMDVALVRDLLVSSPEPLQSKIAVNFSMVLNLMLSHDPDGVRQLLGYSFAAFHPNPRQARKVHKRLLHDFQRHLSVLQELDYVDDHGVPTYRREMGSETEAGPSVAHSRTHQARRIRRPRLSGLGCAHRTFRGGQGQGIPCEHGAMGKDPATMEETSRHGREAETSHAVSDSQRI